MSPLLDQAKFSSRIAIEEKNLHDFICKTHKRKLLPEEKKLENKTQNAINKISTITNDIIQKRLNTPDLQAAITTLKPEFAQYMPTICHKSGRKLQDRYTLSDIGRLIHTHGEERALSIMQLTFTHNTAPEWLFTDYEGLVALSKTDPQGYCIQALSIIMEPYWKIQFKKSNLDIEQKCQIIADKAKARQALEQIQPELIIELNELMRRFLGICKPDYAVQFLAMTCGNMQSMLASLDSIQQVIASLKLAFKNIIVNHARQNKRKKLNAALMADIKAAFHGMSNYYKQLKLGAVTDHEANVLDTRGFFAEHSNIRIQALAVQSQEIAQDAGRIKTIDCSQPLQLKQAEVKESAKPKKVNAFSTMFAKGSK